MVDFSGDVLAYLQGATYIRILANEGTRAQGQGGTGK